MAYDPRTDTGIPTEPVGSLPRPSKLQAAYAEYDAGKIDHERPGEVQDEAVKDSIERMRGHRRADRLRRRAALVELRHLSDRRHPGRHRPGRQPRAAGGQFFAIFADGHDRQLPRLTGGPFSYKTYAADTLKKSIGYATKPMKQAVIAPSMLALLYPLKDEVDGYSREEFEERPRRRDREGHPQAFDAGAERVSVDFTEGRLATRDDPRNPWTGAGMLPHFIELNNRVLDRFSAEERANIGIHTCPGGDRDSVHSADVPYNDLLPSMFKINAGYFLIQMASERDKDPVYESIGKHSREDANGVAQMCYIGVINPQNPRVESPQEVCDQLVRAADFIPKERLGATDDCGFSPFSIDEKPNHGSPDYARDVAFQKIENRVEGHRRPRPRSSASPDRGLAS